MDFQVALVVKNNLPDSAGATGEAGSISGSGRSCGGGNGNPLQNSCLGNPMDRGAWWAIIHGVATLSNCAYSRDIDGQRMVGAIAFSC